jgi:oligoendopeptidase F
MNSLQYFSIFLHHNLRGYDSVIDYLLQEQEVTREMYDRQIDVIMSDLACTC